jgi:predicted enzyme related to lactoylglutathione lyase
MATRTKVRARKAGKGAKPTAKRKPAKAAKKAPPRRKQAAKAWAPPTGPGTFCWNELMTTDTAAAKPFYGALFGWTAQPMGTGSTGEYSVLSRGKDGVAGMQLANPAWDGGRSYWLPSVAVADVDATCAKATTLGAAVVQPPTDVEGFGRYAVLRDPQGALISLWKSNT